MAVPTRISLRWCAAVFCAALFVLAAALAAQAGAERFVLAVQYPPDQKITMPFFRTGALEKIDAEAVVQRYFQKKQKKKKKSDDTDAEKAAEPEPSGPTLVKVEFHGAPAPSSVKPEYRAWVLWAVQADGAFTKLGELGGKKGEFQTELITFGMVVSAEPDGGAAAPQGTFVLETNFPDKKTRFFGMTKVVYAK